MRLGLPAQLGLRAAQPPADAAPADEHAARGDVTAPLAGTLVKWHQPDGATVAAGEVIATLEAMKMETPVSAPGGGTLRQLVPLGDTVAAGQLMARIDGAATDADDAQDSAGT